VAEEQPQALRQERRGVSLAELPDLPLDLAGADRTANEHRVESGRIGGLAAGDVCQLDLAAELVRQGAGDVLGAAVARGIDDQGLHRADDSSSRWAPTTAERHASIALERCAP
jgi:hypothetical protein